MQTCSLGILMKNTAKQKTQHTEKRWYNYLIGKGGMRVQTYRYVTNYCKDTFGFELQSILGSSLDGFCFYGTVEQSSFKLRRNHTFSFRGNFIYPILEGRFFEEEGVTHIVISPKYRKIDVVAMAIQTLLFFAIGVAVFAAELQESILSAVMLCLFLWGLGLVFLGLYYIVFLINTRLSINKLKKTLNIEISKA